MRELPHRYILGSPVDGTSYADACDRIERWAQAGRSCYLIAANVHVVMTAYRSSAYQAIVRGAALVTPDGMPLVWALRALGLKAQRRVYGPDLMDAWCRHAAARGIPLFLYGSTPETLERLQATLEAHHPGLQIVGSHSPPFRPLTTAEMAADAARINASGARVVMVGLGCPKQEEWMAAQQGHVQAVMLGVGAAFAFHSGTVSQAPRWMMASGLEWLYRLVTEPRRLWRRYLFNNPAFLLLFGLQLLRHWASRTQPPVSHQ